MKDEKTKQNKREFKINKFQNEKYFDPVSRVFHFNDPFVYLCFVPNSLNLKIEKQKYFAFPFFSICHFSDARLWNHLWIRSLCNKYTRQHDVTIGWPIVYVESTKADHILLGVPEEAIANDKMHGAHRHR